MLLDIDGTLVDSNYLHVQAWMAAMDEVGHPVSAWQVHRAIGMDATGLLERLLGPKADELGERAKEAHSTVYAGLAGGLRPLRGATGVLAVFAVLGSVVGFCAGCFVYAQLMRIGVIPQEACVECASTDPRQGA